MNTKTPSNLYKVRKELGITQEQFAKIIGCTVKTYRGYEENKPINSDYLKAICEYARNKGLIVSADYILGLSDFKSPENDFIGQRMRLSDEALNNLDSLDTNQINVLNDIILDSVFSRLLQAIHEYRKSHNSTVFIKNEITSETRVIYDLNKSTLKSPALDAFSFLLNNLYQTSYIDAHIEMQEYLIKEMDDCFKKIDSSNSQEERLINTRLYYNYKNLFDFNEREYAQFKKELKGKKKSPHKSKA